MHESLGIFPVQLSEQPILIRKIGAVISGSFRSLIPASNMIRYIGKILIAKAVLLLLFMLCPGQSHSQTHSADSLASEDIEDEIITGIPTIKQRTKLLRQLKVVKPDRKKVDKYIQAANSLLYRPAVKKSVKFDSVFLLIEQAGTLAHKLNYPFGIQSYYMMMGEAYCSQNDLVTMKKIIKIAPDTTKVILLQILASRYWSPQEKSFNAAKSWQLDSAVKYSSVAFEEALRYKRKDLATYSFDILMWCSGMYGRYEMYDKQLQVLDETATKYKNINDWSRATLRAAYGNAARMRGDLKLGVELYHQAEKEIVATDGSYIRFVITTGLAVLYETANENEKVIELLKPKLVEYDKLATPEEGLMWTLMVVKNLNTLKRPEEALALMKEMSQLYPVRNRTDSLRYNLGIGLCYVTLKKIKDAEPFYIMAMHNVRNEHGQKLTQAYSPAIDYYIKSGNFEKAENYLNFYKENLKTPTALTRSLIYRYSFKVDSAKGNYKTALASYMQLRTISDSLNNLTKVSEYRNLETQYKTQKIQDELLLKEKNLQAVTKDAELLNQKAKLSVQDAALQKLKLEQVELLNKKDQADLKLKDQNIEFLNEQSVLQQSQLEQQSTIRNITVVVIGLLAVILALVYRQYVVKQRSNNIITQKNLLLEELVTEKNWLLKEMHHRVKNNLQTIVSLLESQSNFLANNEALSAIQDSQNRVNSMSLIHQKLYQSDNLQYINMSSYLPELINYLKDSFDTRQRIQFKSVIQPVSLDVTQAIPVGLIINEAITNSIKYAFTNSVINPEINVTMTEDDHHITLLIQDNGSGLPADFDSTKIRQGLGLNLIRGLSQDLEGNFSMHSQDGVTIQVDFKANTIINKANVAEPTLSELL